MEREIDKVDAAGTYPCVHCGRRYDLDAMQAVSAAPDAPAECGRDDCEATAAASVCDFNDFVS